VTNELLTLNPLESVAVLGLRIALKETYSTGMIQFWYLLIDIHVNLSHVKVEDGLSILVLKKKNRATRHKNVQLKIV
jgi:uncharacterized membrane protein YozB (DUF420 family)